MSALKIKICGMKHNTMEVAQLSPDYLGFIYYEKSPRNFDETAPTLGEIKKVGVFVNASLDFIQRKIKNDQLDVLQLHGGESPQFCGQLKTNNPQIEIWKVFRVDNDFNFENLEVYENVADKYLFDTKTEKYGGSGKVFDWAILNNYPSQKKFILSGGIGPEHVDEVRAILNTNLPIHAIDLNSKFEIAPGNKDISALREFISELNKTINLNT